MPSPSRLRRAAALVATATGLAIPANAAADTTVSGNWSGYAAHRSGTTFRTVTASWRQPAGSCSAGTPTYSAFWVGLGGYRLSSSALEQVGSELDCNGNGTATLSAWYELVPAPSRAIRMTLGSGDLIRAGVSVAGDAVTITLADVTRGESFRRTIVDHTIDTSSAEWITEAPSACASGGTCTTLPLADFGNVRFTGASATTSTGATGSVSSSHWGTTMIILGTRTAGGIRYVSSGGTSFAAVPAALLNAGRAFKVDYVGATVSSSSGSTGGTGSAPGGFGGNPGGGPGGDSGNPGGFGAGGGGGPFGSLRR